MPWVSTSLNIILSVFSRFPALSQPSGTSIILEWCVLLSSLGKLVVSLFGPMFSCYLYSSTYILYATSMVDVILSTTRIMMQHNWGNSIKYFELGSSPKTCKNRRVWGKLYMWGGWCLSFWQVMSQSNSSHVRCYGPFKFHLKPSIVVFRVFGLFACMLAQKGNVFQAKCSSQSYLVTWPCRIWVHGIIGHDFSDCLFVWVGRLKSLFSLFSSLVLSGSMA